MSTPPVFGDTEQDDAPIAPVSPAVKRGLVVAIIITLAMCALAILAA